MQRRDFIKLAAFAGLASLGLPGCSNQTPEQPVKTASPVPAPSDELVVAQGNDPATLLEKGFKALGGIEQFVKKGNTVVIKPNFSVNRKPDEACTTNPVLVATVVKMCLATGAKEVKVIDFPFQAPAACLESSGIKAAVEAAGGKAYVITAAKAEAWRKVDVKWQSLQSIHFSADVMDADVFINMPILKHHSVTGITMGLKGMMGLIKDRGAFHATDLSGCIAELATWKRPNLIIMDAIRGITKNGPVGPGPIKEYNEVIFGTDPVAVDAYGAELFGESPSAIPYLSQAAKLGAGKLDWKSLNVKRV